MPEVNPRECMFCRTELTDLSVPANLAFLNHLGYRKDCQQEFQVWTENMQTDFKGD